MRGGRRQLLLHIAEKLGPLRIGGVLRIDQAGKRIEPPINSSSASYSAIAAANLSPPALKSSASLPLVRASKPGILQSLRQIIGDFGAPDTVVKRGQIPFWKVF
jgi:hypothetical protein